MRKTRELSAGIRKPTTSRITSEDLIAEGDRVVARMTITGTHTGDFYGIPATGKRIHVSGIYIVRIANGKIVGHWGEENGVTVFRQPGFKIKLEPVEEQS